MTGPSDHLDGSTATSKSYDSREGGSDTTSARIGSYRITERARDRYHPRVRRSDRTSLRRPDEAGACAQVVRSIRGKGDGLLDRPARRGKLPPGLRDRRRNRVLVSWNL